MSRRGQRAVWSRARAVASKLSPAATWRDALAAVFLELDDVAASWVCTCPPGYPCLARGAALPSPLASDLFRQFLQRVLPAVERDDYSARMVRRFGTGAFPALAWQEAGTGQNTVRRTLFEPAGIAEVVHAFLVVEPWQMVGWLSLGVRTSAPGVVDPLVAELHEVSRLASMALTDALLVAQECGARVLASDRVVSRGLSARESEIAVMVGRGWSDLNIAHHLSISEHTVATYLRRIFSKLGVHTRAELAACAAWLAPPRQPAEPR